ncbi:hypothetical protein [Paraconexibacter sp.]|uniref:hypothetical protein n=1 Tax=Paraconexibacter sp. TaxID=2949640 RepID=UPI003565D03B
MSVELGETVEVRLGGLGPDSLAPSVLALLRAGVQRNPALARGTSGIVVLRFVEGFPPVRIAFSGTVIEVSDSRGDHPVDLEVTGRLPDVLLLVSVPQASGLPLPTSPRGRAALARLADGRVEMDGPIRLGRRVLTLMRIEA